VDNILQDLYDGKIYPAEQYYPMMEEYKALRQKHYEHYSDFAKKIGSPLDKEFAHIIDEVFDTLPLEMSEIFIDGFRLGAKMIIAVFEDKNRNEDN